MPRLVAMNVADGSVLWRYAPSEWMTIPPGAFLAGGVIVVGVLAEQGTEVVGLDAETGAERWRRPVEQASQLVAVSGRVAIVENLLPPAEPSTIITADDRGRFPRPMLTTRLTGYDRATGEVAWTSEVTRPGDLGDSNGAAAGDDTVVIALPAVVAVDDTTGEQLWTATADLGDAAVGHIADDVVVMGGQDDDTVALSLATGDKLWAKPGSPPYDDVWAVADGAVYVIDDGELVAYALADGRERWRTPVDPDSYTWPWIAVDDSVYTMWWNLDARDNTDGSIRWTTDHPTGASPIGEAPRMVSIAAAGTSLLVTYSSGRLDGD